MFFPLIPQQDMEVSQKSFSVTVLPLVVVDVLNTIEVFLLNLNVLFENNSIRISTEGEWLDLLIRYCCSALVGFFNDFQAGSWCSGKFRQPYHIRPNHDVLRKFINLIKLQNYATQAVHCILIDMEIGFRCSGSLLFNIRKLL